MFDPNKKFPDLHYRILHNSIGLFTNVVPNHPFCWIWMRKLMGRHPQRGRMNIRENTKTVTKNVPRLVWELHNGKKLKNSKEVVRHLCNNSFCVNPNHLISGSQKDNVQDMHRAERAHKRNKNV